MQAASQNQLAAYYMGIPVKRIHSLVWGLSGMVAAVAGILFASKGAIDPSTGCLASKPLRRQRLVALAPSRRLAWGVDHRFG